MDAALQDAEERRQLAADLRSEARSVLVDTGLLDMLNARFGEAVVTGSAGYDLMACRELDIHMPCDGERWAEWAGLAADIAIQFDLILQLKHEARSRPGYYGVMVGGFDIYEFVMAGAGETLDDLERWKGLVA